jgi:hypothetical protein
LIRPAAQEPGATVKDRLSDLVWRLHDKCLDFRVISQRPDGLWDQDVYLTTTDKTLAELTKWPVNPDFVDKWKGTVAVMRRDPEGLGVVNRLPESPPTSRCEAGRPKAASPSRCGQQ